MEKGRISATNLDRLQRRLQRSLRQSETPAEVTSQPVSARVTPRLEPLPTKSQPQAQRPSVCYWDGDTLTVKPEYQKLARWSKIAAVQKLCMEDEQLKQQLADKERKSRYRDFLKEQIQEHVRAKERDQEEKAKARVRADKDQEFLKIEASVAAQRKQEQMIRLKDDIMSQVATSRSRKQEEVTSDVSRAREENEKALRSLEEEKQLVLKKKEVRRQIDQKQADLWATERHLQQEQKQADLKRRTEEKRRKEEETESARREKADLKERAAAERAVFFEKLHQQQIKDGVWGYDYGKDDDEDNNDDGEDLDFVDQHGSFGDDVVGDDNFRRKKDVEFEQAKLRESEDLARKEATIETKKQQDLQKRRSQYRQELVDQMVMRQAIFRSRSSAHSLEPCQSRRASEVPGDEAPQALASRLALDEPKALCNAVDGGSSNVGALAILAIVAAVPVALVAIMKRQISLADFAISIVMSVFPVLGPRVDLLKDSWRRTAGFWIGNAALLTIFLPENGEAMLAGGVPAVLGDASCAGKLHGQMVREDAMSSWAT
ncbi:unnamed protein product [Symbiodinium sp. KB8]|nr:unnamed protein product [Symbiodinium sp. KB8]